MNDASTRTANKHLSRPVLEKALVNWVCRVRSKKINLSVTRSALRVAAKKLAAMLLVERPPELEASEISHLRNWKPSESWVRRFVTRNSMSSVILHGTAGEVDLTDPKLVGEIEKIKVECSKYDIACIYNVDEYGLFFKCLPRRTYLAPNETKKDARGTKKTKMKDRVTCWACANANGTLIGGAPVDGNINQDSGAAIAEAQQAVLDSNATELLEQWEQFDDNEETVMDLLTEDIDNDTVVDLLGHPTDVVSSSESESDEEAAAAAQRRHQHAEALSAWHELSTNRPKYNRKARLLCLKLLIPALGGFEFVRDLPDPVRQAADNLKRELLKVRNTKRKQSSLESFIKKRDRCAEILAALSGGDSEASAEQEVVAIDASLDDTHE